MRNFNRGSNRFSGGRDFKKRDFSRRDSSDRFQMHRTTCSKCGNDCEVPFRPTGEKPVYCNKCFEGVRHTDSKKFERRDVGGYMNEHYKKQFETLNWKLDKLLKILTPAIPQKASQEEQKKVAVENLKSKKKKPATKEEVAA